jgi:hypothetical protein
LGQLLLPLDVLEILTLTSLELNVGLIFPLRRLVVILMISGALNGFFILQNELVNKGKYLGFFSLGVGFGLLLFALFFLLFFSEELFDITHWVGRKVV